MQMEVKISGQYDKSFQIKQQCDILTGRVSGQVPFENVELGALLGKGGYGSVFRGIKEEPGKPKQIVAIKVGFCNHSSNIATIFIFCPCWYIVC